MLPIVIILVAYIVVIKIKLRLRDPQRGQATARYIISACS